MPGEFRSLKEGLRAEQIAVTQIPVPPHADFEQELSRKIEGKDSARVEDFWEPSSGASQESNSAT